MIDLEKFIRDVPDFPKPGIIFKDITPLLGDIRALRETAERMAAAFKPAGVQAVVGIESRGFIFGSMVADRLGAGFVPIRKPGKLPWKTVSATYELEYGSDTVEMHIDAIGRGQKVLIVDDLLATGGTAAAACELVEKVGGAVVGVSFVVELAFLPGRERLAGRRVESLIQYNAE